MSYNVNKSLTYYKNIGRNGLFLLEKKDFNELFNVFFIKKERIYTKLKYSRVPQFDVASGAIASLFGALLGFMITEKFGWELIDSGDFYTLFMYLVFLVLTTKVIFKTSSMADSSFLLLSTNSVYLYYTTILFILLKFIKYIFWSLVKFFK